MGQQHHSPGQSVATKRREAPPWVTEKRQINALKGPYKIGASIMVCTKKVGLALSGQRVCLCAHSQGCAALCPGLKCSSPLG